MFAPKPDLARTDIGRTDIARTEVGRTGCLIMIMPRQIAINFIRVP
jgi:hypothetical protein